MILKIHKTQVSEQGRLRNLKFKSFQVSITMISTLKKFTSLGEDWSNLYAGFFKGVASILVFASLLEDEQRLSVGVLLMVLKSEIKPSNSATFHNIQLPNIAIGLIPNHFHEFW